MTHVSKRTSTRLHEDLRETRAKVSMPIAGSSSQSRKYISAALTPKGDEATWTVEIGRVLLGEYGAGTLFGLVVDGGGVSVSVRGGGGGGDGAGDSSSGRGGG